VLNENDVVLQVLAAQMGEENEPMEYNELRDVLNIMMERNLDYKNTAAAVLQKIIQDLPANAEAAR
jgi:hypothetical protein